MTRSCEAIELDDGSYIIVSDEELEDLEPQKTREIDLRAVRGSQRNCSRFSGTRVLPDARSKRPRKRIACWRRSWRKAQRAGIATFVMRDREYLVAIFAQNGILCAETLRFHDEVRDPRDDRLARAGRPRPRRVAAFERAIDALSAKTLSRDELVDQDSRKLRAIIDKKKAPART